MVAGRRVRGVDENEKALLTANEKVAFIYLFKFCSVVWFSLLGRS